MASGRLTRLGVLALLALLAGIGMPARAQSAEPLRFVVGTMSYPFEEFDAGGRLTGGLLKEMGERLAQQLGTQADFVRLPRRRVEPALLAGEVDITCYSSPQWSADPDTLLWSVPSLAQVERVMVLKGQPVPENIPADFVGKRVSVRLGYHYGAIQPLFDAGKATRLNETQTPFMVKAVETGLADLLISSEGEIEGYFRTKPQARSRFTIASRPFSVVQTQCAVSPKSRWSLKKINEVLLSMIKRGEMDRLSRSYGLTMQ